MKKMTGDAEWAEGRWRKEKNVENLEKLEFPCIRRASDYMGSGLSTYKVPRDKKQEVMISELYKNVRLFPQGRDRGILTEVVEMVKENPGLDRNLSEIHDIIDLFDLNKPTYGVSEDMDRRDHWTEKAQKLCVRAYDTTNRSLLKNGMARVVTRKGSNTEKDDDPLRHTAEGGVTKKRNRRNTN
jgi:hypothetical protein